jgi:SAM-dependent methyltransferase
MTGAVISRMSSNEAYGWRSGRWSALVGRAFVEWLERPSGLRWLDVGCGQGALSGAVLAAAAPASLCAIDPSAEDLSAARSVLADSRCEFQSAAAEALPFAKGSFDVVVSGLVFHFFRDPLVALSEMRRVVVPGGCVAGYTWDFGDGMQVLRRFWDAAIATDRAAAEADQARLFQLWKPEPLRRLFVHAGLERVELQSIDVAARIPDFDTYWTALTFADWSGGRYLQSIALSLQERVQRRLQDNLSFNGDGSFTLTARAWAIRGMAVAAAE